MDPLQSGSSFLASLERFGVQLGLERMLELLDRLGHPQQGIPVIHVAGTNGKGSVCAMLSQCLRTAGYRVGRYTSPHLVSWRERIWVNGDLIPETAWQAYLMRIATLLKAYPPDLEYPTQFEVITAVAWLYFQACQVDCVLLEVGLGGRLDATNVGISPVITIITSIGWDHWQRLGSTLGQIAFEKAGICKPRVPLITTLQSEEVLDTIKQVAASLEVPLTIVDPVQRVPDHKDAFRWKDQTYTLSLKGDVQLTNVALVLEALDQLQSYGWTIPPESIHSGLLTTQWPGRLQTVCLNGRKLLIDGAHNQPAAVALRQYIDLLLSESKLKSVTWSIGVLETKDVTGILKALLRPGDSLQTLPISDHSGVDPDYLKTLACQIQPDLAFTQSFADLQSWYHHWCQSNQGDTSLQVLCGSLYLMGQLMAECLSLEAAT